MTTKPPTASLPSYQAVLAQASETLQVTSDTPKIDAEVLLQYALDKPLAWIIAHATSIASSDHIKHFTQLVDRRALGEPIAYITGEKEILSLSLKVDQNVLIPRADTETLVEHALACIPTDQQICLLDLGTGSGAIALSLAKERPLTNVVAVDAHQGAISLAEENAQRNGISNVEFLLSDWYEALPRKLQFDLIAANPPYVAPNDPHLSQGDLRFEPDSALIATGNGFDDFHSIVATAPNYLRSGGFLFLEHGYDQAEQLSQILLSAGFDKIQTHLDLNKIPRCTQARLCQ